MNELNLFESIILIALRKVDQSYYATTYENIQTFRHALRNRTGRFAGDNFERFGERVFCYEFYHQLRILIDRFRAKNPNYLQGAMLQGEVEKMQILALIRRLGLTALNGEYSPDFLMHSPGNANAHPCVIEVKCEHDISESKVLTDVKKIDEFIVKFNYQRGIFIATNTNTAHMAFVLQSIRGETKKLSGRANIKVICKPDQEAKPRIWQL